MRQLFRVTIFLIVILAAGNITAQTVLKQDGKFGLSDAKGDVVLRPEYDLVEMSYYAIVYLADSGRRILEKKPTGAPLYYIKQGNKYAFTYKVVLDSLTWLRDKSYWYTTSFEFDSLRVMSIGSGDYKQGYGYMTIAYLQQGKWGMIYIQAYTSSGDGIFPSAGFSVGGLGKMNRKEARYDKIWGEQYNPLVGVSYDEYYPTLLNGKYGLWDPIRNEEYAPQFDTIPVIPIMNEGRIRYVKKNGKWGVIRLDEKTKTMEYLAPCKCNVVGKVEETLYGCTGRGDTIRFFDANTKDEYMPVYNGQPFVFNTDSEEISLENDRWIEAKSYSNRVIVILVKNSKHPPPERMVAYNRAYIINYDQKTLTAYEEPGMYYSMVYLQEGTIVEKGLIHSSTRKREYKFYKAATGEFRFSFSLDSNYQYDIEAYIPRKCVKEDEDMYVKLLYYNKRNKRRTIGYYNSREGILTRRKPRYKAPSQ